jgi:hypothetical protein
MPLARIITGNAEEAFAVSEYLRSEGYTVETVSPAEFRITPAELELDLNRCRRTEAMDRARALVTSQRSPVQAQLEASPAPEPVRPQKNKAPIAYDIVGRPVTFADEEETESQKEPGSRRKALAALFSRVTAPVHDFRRRRAEKRAVRLEARLARNRQKRMARERAQQELDRRRAEAELAERRRQEQVAAERLAEQERARAALVREAGISVARETPRQHAEVVAAQELARQEQDEPASVENPVRQQLPARRPEPARPLIARRRTSTAILRRVGMTALGASLIAMLGFVAYANRRPASPLSPAALIMNESMKQEVPFGAVTLTPPAAASRPSLIANGSTRPAVRSTQGWPRGRRQRASSQADADDVTVGHFQQRSSNPQSTASAARLKRHSDAD